MALRTISLCSGIGGLDIGLDLGASRAGLGGSRSVCMVEGEAFAVATLAAQMEQGGLAPAPIWSDLRTFDARQWRGIVDCVAGGYPCQPFSSAGRRRGAADPSHLWPVVARVIRECQPAICFFENVSGHMSLGARDVILELQGMGYDVACSLWTAEEVGAPHRRERMFIMGLQRTHEPECDLDDDCWCVVSHAEGERLQASGLARRDGAQVTGPASCGDDVADTNRIGLRHPEGQRWEGEAIAGHVGSDDMGDADGRKQLCLQGSERAFRGWACDPGWWKSEPNVGRVAYGISAGMDRLRALGNAVVPEQAARAFVELYDALA